MIVFCPTLRRNRLATTLLLLFASLTLSAQTVRQKVDTLIELMQSGKWQEAEAQTNNIELTELQAADSDTQFDFCYYAAALTDELYPDSTTWQINFLNGAINVFESSRAGELYPYVECLYQMSVVKERENSIDDALFWIQKAWAVEMGNASIIDSSFIPTLLLQWRAFCRKAGKEEDANQLSNAAKNIAQSGLSNASFVAKYNVHNDAEWNEASAAIYRQFARLDTLLGKGMVEQCLVALQQIDADIETVQNAPVRLFLKQIALSQRGGLLSLSGPSAEGETALLKALEIGKFPGGEAYYARILAQLRDYYGAIGSKNNEFIYALKAKVEMENAHLFTDEYFGYLCALASSMPEQIRSDVECQALYSTALHELNKRLPRSLPILLTAQLQYAQDLLNHNKPESALQYAEGCVELAKQLPEFTPTTQMMMLPTCLMASYEIGDYTKVRHYSEAIKKNAYTSFNTRFQLIATALDVATSFQQNNASTDVIEQMEQMLNILNQDLKESFCNLSERRRVNYHNMTHAIPYLIYNCSAQHPSNNKLAALSYNAVLSSKGTLLKASNHIERLILSSKNEQHITAYRQAMTYSSEADKIADSDATLANRYIYLSDSIQHALISKYENEAISFHCWQEVQKNLQPEDVAIEYIAFSKWDKYATDTTLYAAAIIRKDWDAPRFVTLPVYDNMSRVIAKSSAFSLYEEGDTRLKEQLWDPIEKVIGDSVKRVYYSPAGIVNQIAMHAMPFNGNQRLMDRYELHCLSSTEQLIDGNSKKQDRPTDAMLFGHINYGADSLALAVSSLRFRQSDAVVFHNEPLVVDNNTRAGLTPLDNTKQEIDGISRQINDKGISCSVLTDIDACEEAFKAISGKSPSIIHLATHGFFLKNQREANRQRDFLGLMGVSSLSHDNAMRRSGLMLAGADAAWCYGTHYNSIEDGVLTADEIAQLDLSNTNLIVLSACETGLGDISNYEGVFGLQRAFKQAGVKTIVMSLWKVPDEATSLLMQEFYKNYLSGLNPNDSLHKAQKTLRLTHPNPRDWAAFVVLD